MNNVTRQVDLDTWNAILMIRSNIIKRTSTSWTVPGRWDNVIAKERALYKNILKKIAHV